MRVQIWIDRDFKDMLSFEADSLGLKCPEEVLEKIVNDYFIAHPDAANWVADDRKMQAAREKTRLEHLKAVKAGAQQPNSPIKE